VTPAFHTRWGEFHDRIGLWMSGRGPVTPDEELAVRATFTGVELDRKVASVLAHASQTAGLAAEMGEEDFRAWWSTEYFVAASRPM
jgi:hypothetical protein